MRGGFALEHPARRRRRAWLAGLAALTLTAAAALLLFRSSLLPLLDGHPHRLGRLSRPESTAMTEADFEAAFGCPGRLVSGSRTPGTAYTVEWSDDTQWKQVSFDAGGRWAGTAGSPFFGLSPGIMPTERQRLLVRLREMGLDMR